MKMADNNNNEKYLDNLGKLLRRVPDSMKFAEIMVEGYDTKPRKTSDKTAGSVRPGEVMEVTLMLQVKCSVYPDGSAYITGQKGWIPGMKAKNKERARLKLQSRKELRKQVVDSEEVY